MIQHSFLFKLEITTEKLTARSVLEFMAELNHAMGLRALTDRHLP